MQLTNRRVHLMGTVIDVSIYHNQPEPVLDQVEALLHLYNSDSLLMTTVLNSCKLIRLPVYTL